MKLISRTTCKTFFLKSRWFSLICWKPLLWLLPIQWKWPLEEKGYLTKIPSNLRKWSFKQSSQPPRARFCHLFKFQTTWSHVPSEPRNQASAIGPPPIKCQQHNQHKTIE